MCSGDPGCEVFSAAICKQKFLYLSQELTNCLQELHCQRKFPSSDTSSDSYKGFCTFLKSEEIKPHWVSRELDPAELKDEEIFSLGLTFDIFLTKEKFHSLSFFYIKEEFGALAELDKADCCFDVVDETIHRRIKVGSDSYTQNLSKGLSSVIKNIVLPDLKVDGNFRDMAFYERLDLLANDSSCGVSVEQTINVVLIKEKYIDNYDQYINLIITLELCSGRVSYEKEWVQRNTSIGCLGHHSTESRSVMKENWIPALYGKKVPGSVLTQVKPLICGITELYLSTGKLSEVVKRYLCQKAVMIAPTFTTLSSAVQSFLLSRYKDASKVPLSLIQKVTGKSDEEAAGLIFVSKSQQVVQEKRAATPPTEEGSQNLFASGSAKQKKTLKESFGGGFKEFLKLKRKHGLKGKLDLIKLANYFDKGVFKPGKKSTAAICKSCSLN